MTRREFLASLPIVSAVQPRYIDGVYVHSGQGPIELLAYAIWGAAGNLRLSEGSVDDIPAVDRVQAVLCSLPTWKPARTWMATRAIFRTDSAERRSLRFGVRQRSIYALELHIPDLDTPEKAAERTVAVGATAGDPAFLFVTMQSEAMLREYPIALSTRG